MEENNFTRFGNFEPPKIEDCVLADDYLFFEENTGRPIYLDIENHWKIFREWFAKVKEEHKDEPESPQVKIGTEILKWSETWDVFALYIMMRVHWRAFRDAFLLPDTPPEVRELVDFIMYKKMTEEEMWGDKE